MLSPTKPSGNSCSLVLTLFFPLCKAWENLCSHSTTSQNNNKGLALSKTYTDYIRGFFFFFPKHNKTELQFVPGKWKRAYAKQSLQT